MVLCSTNRWVSTMAEQNFLKIFQGILSSQSFELLSEFSTEKEWKLLQKEEKDVLSQLFLIHGESFVSTSMREKAQEAFTSACLLAPHSAKAHYRLGTFLASSDSAKDLTLAIASLEKSILLDGGFFDAHYALACALLRQGSSREEELDFEKADHSFQAAFTLLGEDLKHQISSDFYWHWGLALFLMGRLSGEPYDIKRALQKYQEAFLLGCKKPDFLSDYANACSELSLLLDSVSYMKEAALLYERAIDAGHKDSSLCLFHSGCCYVHLFEKTLDPLFFSKAETLFHRVVLIDHLEVLWNKMGELYFFSARAYLKKEDIQRAIDCFQKSVALGCQHPVLLAYYAESLLMLYEYEERAELLQDALSFSSQAITLQEKKNIRSLEPYLAQALSFYEIGVYFDDKCYLEKALDIVQQKLQWYPKSAALWYALGLVKTRLAMYERHEETLREATVAFLLASRSLLSRFPHFWNDWGIALLSLADVTGDKVLAQEACIRFDIAIELSQFQEVDWIYNLGCALAFLGELHDDVEILRAASDLLTFVSLSDLTNTDTLFQLALLYGHLGELEQNEGYFFQAEEFLKSYLHEEYEDEQAWCELGNLYFILAELAQEREDREALSFYTKETEKALHQALLFGSDQVYYLLACFHTFLGDYPEAMHYLWKSEEVKSLPPPGHLIEEERLIPLFTTKPFGQFLREYVESDLSLDVYFDDSD